MATKTLTLCDLHSENVEATHALHIGFNGAWRLVDVCTPHNDELQTALLVWTDAGSPWEPADPERDRLRAEVEELRARLAAPVAAPEAPAAPVEPAPAPVPASAPVEPAPAPVRASGPEHSKRIRAGLLRNASPCPECGERITANNMARHVRAQHGRALELTPTGRIKGKARPGIVQWAAENGFGKYAGRVPREVEAAFDAAHVPGKQQPQPRESETESHTPEQPKPTPPTLSPVPDTQPDNWAEFHPTRAAVEDMEQHGFHWVDIVRELNTGATTTPSNREGVSRWLTANYSVIVADATGTVITVRPREDREPTSSPFRAAKPIKRTGKRGGIGNTRPRTTKQILDYIDSCPGWNYEVGGKHIRVTGPNGERATLAITASDYRTPLNQWSELRRLGIEKAATG